MAVVVDDGWMTSDQCPHAARAVMGGWVLSWRDGLYDRAEALAAMAEAERGNLDIPRPGAEDEAPRR